MKAVTDRQISESIMDELNWDHGVCPVGIEVSVTQARVRLSGSVPDVEQRLRAEAIARLVPGVQEVISDLTVEAAQPAVGHSHLVRRIQAALSGLGCVDAEAIQIRIEGGWVKLSGLVGTEERRQHLIWMLQKLLGIREVAEVAGLGGVIPA